MLHDMQLLPESGEQLCQHQVVWHDRTGNIGVFTPLILEGIHVEFMKSTFSFSGYWDEGWALLGSPLLLDGKRILSKQHLSCVFV